MKCWVGIVSEEHVRRGVHAGIAQIGHGKRPSLARMQPGDGFIYYSAKKTSQGNEPLQAFTAIGLISDAEIWQADEGDFKPWRRRVDYFPAHNADIHPLLPQLSFTAGKTHWGYAFRFGFLEITLQDFELIKAAML